MGRSNFECRPISVRLGSWNGDPARAIAVEGDQASKIDLQKAVDMFANMKSRRYPLSAEVT